MVESYRDNLGVARRLRLSAKLILSSIWDERKFCCGLRKPASTLGIVTVESAVLLALVILPWSVFFHYLSEISVIDQEAIYVRQN